ncbi:MAG: hypothetical protein WDN44_10840 [Sphingomonas sp.]
MFAAIAPALRDHADAARARHALEGQRFEGERYPLGIVDQPQAIGPEQREARLAAHRGDRFLLA